MSTSRQEILKPADLTALVDGSPLDDALPDSSSILLLDLHHGGQLPPVQARAAGTVLRHLNRVVIGVRDEASPGHAFDSSVDLLLTTGQLDPCIAAIDANPMAAMVLVEVLRTTERMPPEDALIVESLAYATLQGGPEHRAWLESERHRHPARTVPPRPDIVLLDRHEGRLEIRLNSPDTRNSLSAAMRDALTEAFILVAMDASIEQVEVSGLGPSFSAGGDLKEFGLAPDPASAHRIRQQRMPARYLLPRRRRYRFRLHGACIGAGIELPAFAGYVTARSDCRIRLPEVAMGLIPGAGGCVSIPRRIGRQRTAYLAISGIEIDADQALRWGLVDAVEPT